MTRMASALTAPTPGRRAADGGGGVRCHLEQNQFTAVSSGPGSHVRPAGGAAGFCGLCLAPAAPRPVSSPHAPPPELKRQVESAELKNQRLKEVFQTKIQEFRKVCYALTGYQVDITRESQYRLTSMYAEHKDDCLIFKVGHRGAGPGGRGLCLCLQSCREPAPAPPRRRETRCSPSPGPGVRAGAEGPGGQQCWRADALGGP